MKKLLAVALMVVLASPAFAAIQNVKVSGDITSSFIDRNSFDLGATEGSEAGFSDGFFGESGTSGYLPVGLKKQNVFITQTRVRIDADLSDNVSTTVGLINERAWGNEGGYAENANVNYNYDALNTNVQLYLASVTMRELLYSPLTVTVGRQVFNYGNGLILGDGGPNNSASGPLEFVAQDMTMRTSYDGVKAILDYKPLTIDMFYFKNDQQYTNGFFNSGKSSSDVYGINANYQLSDPMNTVVEAYMFSRVNGNYNNTSLPTGVDLGQPSNDKNNTLYVPGLRASTNPIKGLNVQGELAWQLGQQVVNDGIGDQLAEKRQAMAAQFLASYSLPVLDKYKPTVNAAYTYVSGDKNGGINYNDDAIKSAKYFTAWDPFNEAQGSGTVYNTLFPLSNMHILALGASVNPLEDVTTSFTWSDLWAAQAYTQSFNNALFLTQPDGGPFGILPATKHNATNLGNEYDVNLTYNYTEDVTFGVSLGWFVPGDVFTSANNNTASQAIANVAVKF